MNFFSSNAEEAQDFRDEVDTKEAKSIGWIKEHALWGPNSQILATRAEIPRAYARIPKPVSTGIENDSYMFYLCARNKWIMM